MSLFRPYVLGCLLALIAIAASVDRPLVRKRPRLDGKIVGGYAIEIDDAPYQISLQRRGSHICGGTFIDHQLVLTAAHCVYQRPASDFQVRYGSTQHSAGGMLVNVSKITVHPKYDPNTIDYDIAALKLQHQEYRYEGDVVQGLAELPTRDLEIPEGTDLLVSGWGRTQSPLEASGKLRAVIVPKVSQESCNRSYSEFGGITPRMLCAGPKLGGKDACQGDSGGPLVNNETNTLVGVVSWGYGCAIPHYPGVYTRVASVRDWILSITGL